MPLRRFRHKITGELLETLGVPDVEDWEALLSSPNCKLMVTANKAMGTSSLKDAKAILKERSRNHARDFDAEEQITISEVNGMGDRAKRSLCNEKGERRTKLDDL